MARPANPENRYSFTCKVTGETVKTNPKQFAALANRYGITNEELDVSYVSRAGRRKIADEKLTPEQAVEKYGIHLNVAKSLKCTVKEKVQKVKATAETSATETPVSEQTEVQPTDELVEAINNAAIEVSETTVQDEQSVETVVSETPVESGEEVSA
jgi:hypothetical protein